MSEREQGGATEEQIDAIALAKYPFRHYGSRGSWDAPEGCACEDCIITSGKQYAYEEGYADALSASVSAHPADERHDAEERLARIQRLLGPLRNRIDEYGAVPLRHAVISTLEALSGRSAEECEGLSVNDHCCQHPKCPGGGLCCCESEDHAAMVTGDREKLIAEADGWVSADLVHRHAMSALDTIRRLRAALAAPVEVDESKLAEVLRSDTRLCYPDGAPVDWGQVAAMLAKAMRGGGR